MKVFPDKEYRFKKERYKMTTLLKIAINFRTLAFTCGIAVLFAGCGSMRANKAIAGYKSPPPVRMNIKDLVEDPQLLAAYTKAISQMRKNGRASPESVAYKNSLIFWANTHGFIGDPDVDPNATDFLYWVVRRSASCVANFKEIFAKETGKTEDEVEPQAIQHCTDIYRQVETPFRTDDFSNGIWGTCQHTAYSPQFADTPRFLPWHRLYLYYFEKTVQKLGGDPNLALPYWDYFDYPNAKKDGLFLPPLVESPDNNTFYDGLRTYNLNERKSSIRPDMASAKDAFTHNTYHGFSERFEGEPHGMIHCAVGDGCSTPHMGWVPLAGNDPLFYMHHANIDRLWQCWLNRKANGEEITLEWAKKNLGMPDDWYDVGYYFSDENGKKVYRTIADAFSPEVLATRYSTESNCQLDMDGSTSESVSVAAEMAPLALLMKEDRKPSQRSLGSIDLASQTTRHHFEVETLTGLSVDSAQDQYNLTSGAWIILENVQVLYLPHYTYRIFISNKDQPDKKAIIGAFNFFGFGEQHGHHAASNALGTLKYLVSDDLQEIGVTDIAEVQLEFVPTSFATGVEVAEDPRIPITIDAVHFIEVP